MNRILATLLATTILAGPAFAAKDSITLGMPLEPPVLDPTAGAAAAIKEVTYANIFQGLTRIAADGTVAPQLAKSWTISADGLTYTFALNSGVTFHNGAAFGCSVVKFTYERAVATDSTNASSSTHYSLANSSTQSFKHIHNTFIKRIFSFFFNKFFKIFHIRSFYKMEYRVFIKVYSYKKIDGR